MLSSTQQAEVPDKENYWDPPGFHLGKTVLIRTVWVTDWIIWATWATVKPFHQSWIQMDLIWDNWA